MAFVALKPMKVGSEVDEEGRIVPVVRQPGDHVPEADGWRDTTSYIIQGKLAFVPDGVMAVAASVDQLQATVRDLTLKVDELAKVAHSHNKQKNS